MKNNLLDKITWNFIHEKQSPNGIEYLKSVSIKIKQVLNGSLSKENRSYLNTALNDLTEINRYVNRLLGTITELESENQKLKKEIKDLNKQIEKAKVTKE